MLLQTNSYIVPKEKRAEHARLLRRFRQTLLRLGCDHFEAYEQVGANWTHGETTGRYVQIMRFKDRKHQLAVQAAERADATAQALISEFCEQINFTYQQQQGLFAVGYYTSMLPPAPGRMISRDEGTLLAESAEAEEAQLEATDQEAPVEEEVEEELLEAAAGDGTPGLHTLTGGPVGEADELDSEIEEETGSALTEETSAESTELNLEETESTEESQATASDEEQQPQGGR